MTQGEITELNLHHSGSEATVAPQFFCTYPKKVFFFLLLRPSPHRTLLPPLRSFVPTVFVFFVIHSCGFTISGFTPPLDHIACPSQENKLSAWTEMRDAEMSLSGTHQSYCRYLSSAVSQCGRVKKKCSLLFQGAVFLFFAGRIEAIKGNIDEVRFRFTLDCEFTPTGQSLLH